MFASTITAMVSIGCGVLIFASATLATDCNSNGIADTMDLAGGTSNDCNSNSVPDECENILFVDDSATNGLRTGASWANAYVLLQDALSDASTNCVITQVWIASGMYTPDQGGGYTPLDRSATFQLQNGVAVYGGFAGTEVSLVQRNVAINNTVLSGDLLGNDLPVPCVQDSPDCDSFGRLCANNQCVISDNNDENSFNVVTGSGTDTSAILDGVTITAGNATEPGGQNDGGGGMYNDSGSPHVIDCTFSGNAAGLGAGMENDNLSNPIIDGCSFTNNSASGGGGMSVGPVSNPTIVGCEFRENFAFEGGGMRIRSFFEMMVSNCVFDGNVSLLTGGAVYINSSLSRISDCRFTGNVAQSQDGGGIFILNGSPTLLRCMFGNNVSGQSGGAIRDGGSTSITNCRFGGNAAGTTGGGIYHVGFSTFTNCSFAGNIAASNGGGLYNHFSDSTLINCLFTQNEAIDGGGIFNNGTSSPSVTNCILWNNIPNQITTDIGTPVVNYSIVQGGWNGLGGIGVLATDPMLADSDGIDDVAGTEDDDHRLMEGSPAIDAGNNNAIPPGIVTDLDGHGRFVDDPNSIDTGIGTPPIVDLGPLEFFLDCNSNGTNDDLEISSGTSVDCNENGFIDECESISGGDFNGDGDVDLLDYASFEDCFSGPTAQPSPKNPGCVNTCLMAFDSELDSDVDLADFATLQIAFGP